MQEAITSQVWGEGGCKKQSQVRFGGDTEISVHTGL